MVLFTVCVQYLLSLKSLRSHLFVLLLIQRAKLRHGNVNPLVHGAHTSCAKVCDKKKSTFKIFLKFQ